MFAQSFPTFDQLPESKLPPDPLKMSSGEMIKTPEDWFQKQRPELLKLAQHYMYGVPPVASAKVTAEVVRTDATAFGGKGIVREVTLSFGPENKGRINLLLITPAKPKGKVSMFAGLNFNGNHTVLADPKIALPSGWVGKSPHSKDNRATEAGRGVETDGWSAELLVDRGYGLATAYYGDIDPDKPDWSDGVHALYYRAGQTEPAANEWSSVAAWAWGLSRIADYLVTLEEVDAKRTAVIGHSRLGKAALWAGATDERFTIVCPHQSGTGGAALSRDNNQETVERINRVFPHWFCKNFHAFGNNEAKIPFDQHTVMALCAPRPILDTEGEQDKWANYDNSFRSLQGADAVYKFLGKRGLKAGKPVSQDEPFSAENFGELVQYRRDAKHALTSDYWKRILDFADRWYAESR